MGRAIGANKDNYERTRSLFLDLAEKEFHTHGYANASTSRIVAASGMARGTLYYHFKDKQDLFLAVYDMVMQQVSETLSYQIARIDDPWDRLLACCRFYFDLCSNPQTNKIFLTEAQTILPYDERQGVVSQTIRPILADVVRDALNAGYFKGQNKDMLILLIFGALSEAGRMMSLSPQKDMIDKMYFDTFLWSMIRLK
jgi:AcrR family transcriptional regulator